MEKESIQDGAFGRAASILKYLRGEASAVEEREVMAWMNENEANRKFIEALEQDDAFRQEFAFLSGLDMASAWETVASKTVRRRSMTLIIRYAAAVSLLALAGVFWIYVSPGHLQDDKVAVQHFDVPPGGNRAVLELSDGSIITLEETDDGQVNTTSGVVINKRDNTLIYEPPSEEVDISYNKVSTPTGGQYRVVLPDGTRAWLNAESSLRYPTAFRGNIRTVEMTGEVYLEVAHNAEMPFEVKVGEATITVLGTAFNVMAYGDEPFINTTLVEGSVRVAHGEETRELIPGQQARIGNSLEVVEVDVLEVVAWKDGFFQFNNTNLATIMRQLGRWYGIHPDQEPLPDLHFTGLISRDNPVSEVLRMLELTAGVSFSIEADRRIHLDRSEIK